VEEVELTSSHL